MWLRHWNLTRDPFDERQSPFVETPTHSEAVARLVHAIASASRSARLIAGPGVGKSRVLTEALEATRSPTRRIARANGLTEGDNLFATLAAGLGARLCPDASRTSAWRALVNAARLCRWQGVQVVLAIDDCHAIESGAGRIDLDRLDHLDPDPSARLTLLRVGRPSDLTEELADGNRWELSARLEPLTRSETANYLTRKLDSAGRFEPTFTPRALTRLHLLSGGVSRGLDRLATLSLMASAIKGLEMVPPDVVDDASRECLGVGMVGLD